MVLPKCTSRFSFICQHCNVKDMSVKDTLIRFVYSYYHYSKYLNLNAVNQNHLFLTLLLLSTLVTHLVIDEPGINGFSLGSFLFDLISSSLLIIVGLSIIVHLKAEFQDYKSVLLKIGALSYASGHQNLLTAYRGQQE